MRVDSSEVVVTFTASNGVVMVSWKFRHSMRFDHTEHDNTATISRHDSLIADLSNSLWLVER